MSSALQVSLIAEEQIPAAGEMLARALFDDPLCVYAQPDPEARMNQFTRFFTELVREGTRQRSVYASTCVYRPNGIAVWMPPRPGEQPGTHDMRLHFDPEAQHRFASACRHFERIHRQSTAGPHWYLGRLGVSPQWQGRGIGRTLLTPVLQRADRECLPCYLETFVPRNVPFYERLGFRVVDAGVEPRSQVPFWAMRRRPAGDGVWPAVSIQARAA